MAFASEGVVRIAAGNLGVDGSEFDRKFLSVFGAKVEVVALTWNLLLIDFAEGRYELKHFLWTCHWLKGYGKEADIVNRLRTTRPTFRQYRNRILVFIFAMKGNVVSLHILNVQIEFHDISP